MRIIRLEYPNGEGMYRREETPFGTAVGSPEHPTPLSDAGMSDAWCWLSDYTRLQYLFGFASAAQCMRWMYAEEHWRKSEELGLLVVIYEVPAEHCIVGYTQAAFNCMYAEEVERYTPSEWRVLAQRDYVQPTY